MDTIVAEARGSPFLYADHALAVLGLLPPMSRTMSWTSRAYADAPGTVLVLSARSASHLATALASLSAWANMGDMWSWNCFSGGVRHILELILADLAPALCCLVGQLRPGAQGPVQCIQLQNLKDALALFPLDLKVIC